MIQRDFIAIDVQTGEYDDVPRQFDLREHDIFTLLRNLSF